MEPQCRVRLDIFEGPLDLLLHLITKNRLDITDIPIHLVTNQYLEYLEFLKALDIEVAAEYLLMATTLIQIKSRMLLPKRQDLLQEDQEDPRLEITIALKELKKAKELADKLDSRPILGRDVFQNNKRLPDQSKGEKQTEELVSISVFELVEAFKRLLKKGGLPRTIEIERARIKLSHRIRQIETVLQARKRISFFDLIQGKIERFSIIITFLAILELSKKGKIRLFQQRDDSDIIIIRRKTDVDTERTGTYDR